MNLNNAYAVLTDNAFTVQVKFPGSSTAVSASKPYTYLCDISEIVVGDDAVVFVSSGDYEIPKVVKVVSVDRTIDVDLLGDIDYKWIVQRVDTTDYDRKLQEAQELQGKLAKLRRDAARNQLKSALVQALGLDASTDISTALKD